MKRGLRQSYVLTGCLVCSLLIIFILPLMALAEPIEEWVARYNSPGSGEDAAYAMVVDGSGNIYVTGEVSSGADSHYATVKYDTHGNELWAVRYNTPGDNMDRATAIAIDSSGNVYVTGWVDTPPGYVYRARGSAGYPGWDYATVKYDTNGNELWVKRYSGPGNDIDRATAIAVDASGNVYVTGQSWGSGTDADYATVKYDTHGNELWVKRYNGPGNDSDGASTIAVDPSGNVCVSGGSAGNGASFGYATVKYDTHGNELWVKRYEGLGYYEDGARAIAIDPSGNVYVTGSIHDNGLGDSWADYATVKYDTNGNELWVKRYNSPESDGDWAGAIAVDASGNVYVTGESDGSGTNRDYATVKYDTNGNELWEKRYNGPGNDIDRATAIAVDASGNVYVTGQSWGSGTDADYATVKYDTHGNELWVGRYNSPENGEDEAKAIAVDAWGNVYVTGWSIGLGTGSDYATVKYDTHGDKLWVARYHASTSDYAKAIAVDAAGNVYVTGRSYGVVTGDDYATVKYDTHGNELWVRRYNGPGNDDDRASAIAVDVSGNVYVTGGSIGIETDYDYATVKYDTDGNELWVARYKGSGNGYDGASAIAIDVSGNIYVTGVSPSIGTNLDYATVKYDTDGNQLWVGRYNSPGNGEDEANAIGVDAWGNVYVTGWGIGLGTGSDYATVKYDTDGNMLWVKRYNGPGNGYEYGRALAIDAWGNVYVSGGSYGDGTGYDYATVKYDTNGNELWVKRYNSLGMLNDYAGAIAVDAFGNVSVTGKSWAEGIGIVYDYATVKYDTHGNELWVKRYNGPGNGLDSANAIAVDALGNVYVTGESEGSWTGSDYATVKYREVEEVEVTMELPAGWSMISLPVTPAVTTLGTLFPEAMAVYRYEKVTGYAQVAEEENVEVGVGYWILFDAPQSVVIKGTEITEYTMPVENGWYMIGGCSLPARKMVTTGKMDVIYGYTQGIGYTRLPRSEPLERGKGYWILFSNTAEGAEFTASTSVAQ